MDGISSHEVAELTGGVILNTAPDAMVQGVSISSREIHAGQAFVAFVGERVDGHDFVHDAQRNGACALIVTKPVEVSNLQIPVIQVADALAALQRTAQFDRSRFAGPVIGVTGSNGKTTTKDMLAAVLSARGSCTATARNLNNELGMPLTMVNRKPDDWAMVLEMGMRGKNQIAGLCQIAQPTIGVITNIGQSHIELLGSQEGIADAKAELLDALPESGAAILRKDDPWLVRMAGRSRARVYWYQASGSECDAYATDISASAEGTHFRAHVLGEEADAFIQTFGSHNVGNAMAALLVGVITGVRLSAAAESLANLQPSSGRLRILPGKAGGIVIDDCYNASPASVQASLGVLRDRADGRPTVAVLGDMYELGDWAESGHREVGRMAAEMAIDTLVCIGELAQWIADEATAAGAKNVIVYPDKEQAITAVEDWLPKDAAVLVKASRGMALETVVHSISVQEKDESSR